MKFDKKKQNSKKDVSLKKYAKMVQICQGVSGHPNFTLWQITIINFPRTTTTVICIKSKLIANQFMWKTKEKTKNLRK